MNKKKLIVIDAYNVFMKHYAANPTIDKNGNHVGGLVGFVNEFKRVVDQVFPQKIIVVWEGGGAVRKRALYPDYKKGKKPKKMNRFYEEIPDTLENCNDQIINLVNLLKFFPLCQVYVDNCEADDVIAYICRNMYSDYKKVVYSSDKDYYQLLSENIMIYSPTSKKWINKDYVLEKFHVSADNFLSARCFIGDKSDNIPGISGVGFKTLSKRIPELREEKFISVAEIQEKVELIKSNIKIKTNILKNKKTPIINWKLMNLDINNLSSRQISKVEKVLEMCDPKPNKISIMRFFNKLGISNVDVNSLFTSLNFSLRG